MSDSFVPNESNMSILAIVCSFVSVVFVSNKGFLHFDTPFAVSIFVQFSALSDQGGISFANIWFFDEGIATS